MHAKKILYIITGGESGGAQTHLFDLCTHLPGGFIPLVAIGVPGSLTDKLDRENVRVYDVPSLAREINLRRDIQAYGEIKRLIKQLQPDLICTHSSKAGVLGRLAAKQAGIPAVFTAHGWAFTEGVVPAKRFLYRQVERMAARWSQKIICVSDYDFQLAVKNKVAKAEQMVVIHNGLPVGFGPGARENRGSFPTRIIMVARFAEPKDQSLLLHALSQLPPNLPFTLDLVGEGPLKPQIMDLAARLNIRDRVEFWGDRADVPDLLSTADIFVLTSHWEGFPMTILEAMRAALPVIVSDVGGCREAILEGQSGYLVKAGDGSTLKDYLQELIGQPERRSAMGRIGYELFRSNFTVEKMMADTLKVYNSVMRV